jgi:hypothetical protein
MLLFLEYYKGFVCAVERCCGFAGVCIKIGRERIGLIAVVIPFL